MLIRLLTQSQRFVLVAGLTSVLVAALLAPRPTVADSDAPTVSAVDFNRDIRPLLVENCWKCHGPDDKERKGKLRLDTREGATAARKGGAAIVPGDAAKSLVIERLTADDPEFRMPPRQTGKRLTPAQVELIRRWIDQGAKWSQHWAFVPPQRPPVPQFASAAVPPHFSPRNPIDHFILARLQQEGLQPSPEADKTTLIRRVTFDLTGLPPTPAEIDACLADTRADSYERLVDRLLASPRFGERMALEWLDAARFADTHGYHIDSGRDMSRWREWIIDAFNKNKPFDQFTIEQLAGDLLAGELGYRPSATGQIEAAKADSRKPIADLVIASGFNRNHMINFEGGAIPEEYHTAYIVDRVNTTATVWLGLTIGCAQCHDHKYDPVTQKEYYQLFAFFHNVPESGLDGSKGNAAPLLKLPRTEQQQRLEELTALARDMDEKIKASTPELAAGQTKWEEALGLQELRKLPKNALDAVLVEPPKRTDKQKQDLTAHYRTIAPELKAVRDQLAKVRQEQAALEKQVPSTMVMQEMPKPRDTFLLVRGQYDKKGEKVAANVPAFLPPLGGEAPLTPPSPTSQGGDRGGVGVAPTRLDLARWLVRPDHPLTARVIVNRYWQMYFGTGLVKTSEDFGSQGEWPSHPELLDWLATEFVGSGWNIKQLQKLIVMSSTYRQSSRVAPTHLAKDPENRLLARGPRFRLPAEFIRDQALAVSGLLNGEIGGHSVSPYQPAGLWEELMSREDGKNWTAQTYSQSHGKDLYRRTMYTFWKRTCPPPTLATFDAPDRETCTVRRARTNTPLQALILMNDPTYVEASRKLAERMMLEGGKTPEEKLSFAFRLATARLPGEMETALLRRVFDEQLAKFRKDAPAAMKLLTVGESKRNPALDAAGLAAAALTANLLLNLDETLTKG